LPKCFGVLDSASEFKSLNTLVCEAEKIYKKTSKSASDKTARTA